MLTSYPELRTFLDNHVDNVLSKLGTEFHSANFIETFRLLYPNEYAHALQFAKTYGLLHSWIARCYLAKCNKIKDLGIDPKLRKSTLGNPTRNHHWKKL